MTDAIEFYRKALSAMLSLTLTRTVQQVQAVGHRWMYRATENTKNVVVIGGSYAGLWLARRLSETLPTGYKAVLVERNSHFNHLFAFPRYGVVPGIEHQAFIPYDNISTFGPPGILQHIRGSAVSISSNQVRFQSGETLDYEYLAIATGSWQPPPSKAVSLDKEGACAELQSSQQKIQDANRIAIVGGGPVGIQIATDIAAYFSEKNVTLVHSHPQLLNNFGPKLHENVVEAMSRLNINVVLGERPQVGQGGELAFKDGKKSQYDLVIPCTGQRPNSAILEQLVPSAVCPTTKQIKVKPTMQIQDETHKYENIFAVGDVAKTGGPRMARAARAQADIITSNILSMINEQKPSTFYSPQIYEGVIKLTLGKGNYIYYGKDEGGKEVWINGTDKSDDLNIAHAWEGLNTKFQSSVPSAPSYAPSQSRNPTHGQPTKSQRRVGRQGKLRD
ncbi:Pyridine nucleotide-disulfide oxidoreductase, FAD/NAD(P)-binding domain protein [Akanthomyces lecanii RCEF 1005]|uniref:Pyridine nucleotide-disulfide oxidoreductase, FAD/NAD(P)-binding domain protein n=1 Tax=Akanthomyces lecanii RCEF 1005 TaxID=1081108 RepID=A0A167RSG5_CORDF|nr:Pyridine nucleotide-disulfide oxidoreductase, FAD/NAD(P)-binding domain protein [Akanthomyces lecanii RCEF 1005]